MNKHPSCKNGKHPWLDVASVEAVVMVRWCPVCGALAQYNGAGTWAVRAPNRGTTRVLGVLMGVRGALDRMRRKPRHRFRMPTQPPSPPPNPCSGFPNCDCGFPNTVLAACDPTLSFDWHRDDDDPDNPPTPEYRR